MIDQARLDKENELTKAVQKALPFGYWLVQIDGPLVIYQCNRYDPLDLEAPVADCVQMPLVQMEQTPEVCIMRATVIASQNRKWLGDSYRAWLAEKEAEILLAETKSSEVIKKGNRL